MPSTKVLRYVSNALYRVIFSTNRLKNSSPVLANRTKVILSVLNPPSDISITEVTVA